MHILSNMYFWIYFHEALLYMRKVKETINSYPANVENMVSS